MQKWSDAVDIITKIAALLVVVGAIALPSIRILDCKMGGGEELSALLGLAAAFALLIVAFIGVWRLSDLIAESLSLNASIRAKTIISLIIVLLGYGAIGSVGNFALSEWASASRACPNAETQSDQQ